MWRPLSYRVIRSSSRSFSTSAPLWNATKTSLNHPVSQAVKFSPLPSPIRLPVSSISPSSQWKIPVRTCANTDENRLAEINRTASTTLAVELCRAAGNANVATLEKFIDMGVDLNKGDYDQRTALHVASSLGNKEVVEFLLKYGANVNVLDRWGGTPLKDAKAGGLEEICALLERHGAVASFDAQNPPSMMALSAAVEQGSVDTVQRLLDNGVEPDQLNFDLRAPLHLACASGQLEIAEKLLQKGASVNIFDRYGKMPVDYARGSPKNSHALLKLLAKHGAILDIPSREISESTVFLGSLNLGLPLMLSRGGWEYGEAWMSNPDGTLTCTGEWAIVATKVEEMIGYRKYVETKALAAGEAIPGKALQAGKPIWFTDAISENTPEMGKHLKNCGFQSACAIPVMCSDHVLAVIVLYDKQKREIDQKLVDAHAAFVSRKIVAGLPIFQGSCDVNKKYNDLVMKEQMRLVFHLLIHQGIFQFDVLYDTITWYYRGLGLPSFYFEHFGPEIISKHITSFISAKHLAASTGDREGIKLFVPTEPGSGVWLSTSRHIKEIEDMIQQTTTDNVEIISFNHYRSSGPVYPDGRAHLHMFILNRHSFAPLKEIEKMDKKRAEEAEEELSEVSNIWELTTSHFFKDKPLRTRRKYEGLIQEALQQIHPVIRTVSNENEEIWEVNIAARINFTRYLAPLSTLVSQHNLKIARLYVDSFANGIVVLRLLLLRTNLTPQVTQQFLEDLSLLTILPYSEKESLFLQGRFNLHEYVYALAAARYAFYFMRQDSDEYIALMNGLTNDPLNMARLRALQKNLRADMATESKIWSCIDQHTELMRELWQEFRSKHDPSIDGQHSAVSQTSLETSPILQKINKAVQEKTESSAFIRILTAFAQFNDKTLKTNLYKKDKAAISFRINPDFLKSSLMYEEAPMGLFMLIGREFTGFHLRFRDVARGGLRIIRSANRASYTVNSEQVFNENYGLAYTQQKKNKDIPEAGSKGTILLHFDSQKAYKIAFRKYVSAMFDLLILDGSVVDHYGKEEVLFFGPDEGTAGYMDWAALYAKSRGWPYWKAITTGKSPRLGGIPHDTYGMTTHSVHRCVTETLKKYGLPEEGVTKIQTGGPDGDLGSNEILQSKDKTIAVIDKDGVIYDPQGLDRSELVRLVKLKSSIKLFDSSKLSKSGFKVMTDDRDVIVGNGIKVTSGLVFRDEFILSDLATADLFVPCGGRPQAVRAENVNKFFKENGKPKFLFIVEGANLYFSQEARLILEKAGAHIVNDATANKGGVTSSSLEVLASMVLTDAEFNQHFAVKDERNPPPFYKNYVNEVIDVIERNAKMEFDCLWNEHEKTKIPKSILTDELSNKINKLNDDIRESDLIKNEALRRRVLAECLPPSLVKLVGMDNIMQRLPQAYADAIFAAHLAAHYVYSKGMTASEFAFYEFMKKYTTE